MECPICHDYYFADDTESEKQEPNYEGKRDDYCMHCGWKYDLYQVEHPAVENLTNKLSSNNYKKWFEDKVSKNPDYDYTEQNYTPTPHTCPVCGKYTFEDISSFDICPFCGWEDDELMEENPTNFAGYANHLCLNDYKIEMVQNLTFSQSYKSILINLKYVKEILNHDVILEMVPVSRHYRKKVEKYYFVKKQGPNEPCFT